MPYRKTKFANEEIYHIILRRIGNELLFVDDDDYFRGVFSLYEFNDSKPVEIYKQRQARLAQKQKDKKEGGPTSHLDKRDKLVEVLAFTLMPNHIHLLLRQSQDDGIIKFVRKFSSGYPLYFKKKYGQSFKGYFFQSRFVSVHIKTDEQLVAVFVYIHTNPLSLIEPGWKEGKVKDIGRAIEFLENYRWSSLQDYLGKKNFPSLTERNFLGEILGGQERIKKVIKDWIENKKEVKGISLQ